MKMRVSVSIIEDFMASSSTEIKLIEVNKALRFDRFFDELLVSSCGSQPLLKI